MRRKREEELIFIGMVSDGDGDGDGDFPTNSVQMPPPEYSTAYQTKLDQISEFRRELQVTF